MIRYISNKQAVAAKIVAAPKCIRTLEERMADDMREMAFAGQNVSVETLIERGWTKNTVHRLARAATAIARRQSTRQVA
ncbi:hypothetical protein [Rhizobium sp. Root483D2]|uniref:hypothetical protein n=1 Tax=Rhizobium sp. Root483D2 TaxID=1736545 RepID=UPI0007128190|nr:hypothetical protein [Rhizobium sp. Root483D2]KQY31786.1 hypothetical protein ASD32_04110 [Rhizobium sp. Root483D2]